MRYARVMQDTDPHADRVQLGLLRAAGEARRAAACLALSDDVLAMSRRALRERMAGASEREVLLRWAALAYGEELAARVRAYRP